MNIPEQGHGPVVLTQKDDGSLQLRDNLSHFWCACGQPAVLYKSQELEQYRFQCVKCGSKEATHG